MSKVVGVLLWYILRLLILASLVSNYRSFSLEKLYTDPLVNLHMQVVLSNLLLIIQSDHILNSCTFQDFRTGTTTRFQLNWESTHDHFSVPLCITYYNCSCSSRESSV
jgi:hypothetical protein